MRGEAEAGPGSATEDDAAWVRLTLPIGAETVAGFLQNIALVLRINPCIEFEHLVRMANGRWHLAGRNDSNAQSFDTDAEFVAEAGRKLFELRYGKGIKRMTRFEVLPDLAGCILAITESYCTPDNDEQALRLTEVDRSLTPWAAALRAHLLRRARWSGVPGYGWLAERVWFGMPPRQRRVAWLIVWTTLLEFVVFLAALAIYLAR